MAQCCVYITRVSVSSVFLLHRLPQRPRKLVIAEPDKTGSTVDVHREMPVFPYLFYLYLNFPFILLYLLWFVFLASLT